VEQPLLARRQRRPRRLDVVAQPLELGARQRREDADMADAQDESLLV
jgi:hypothetical protein